MITITLEQARVALECVENDIFISEQGGGCDFSNISELTFYLRRAELRERLTRAIANAEK